MARKHFSPPKRATGAQTDAHPYASFMRALLAGDIEAERLIETRTPPGRLDRLEYDEPSATRRKQS